LRYIFGLCIGSALILTAIAVSACGRSAVGTSAGPTQAIELANEPGSIFKVSLRDDLVQVDGNAVAGSIVAMSSDGSAFVFNHAPAALLGAKPGTTILLAGLALRKVSSIETNGNFALVRTDPATLSDAIANGTMAWDHPVTFGALGQISENRARGRWGSWIEAFSSPALADASVSVKHTGTVNGWQYKTETTVGNNRLIIDEMLMHQGEQGMQILMHAKCTISNFSTLADIEIQNGQIVKFTYINKNVTGTIDFDWTATKSEPGVGTLPQSDKLVVLPPLISIPLDLQGFPFTLNIDSAMLVEPAFTASDEMTRAHFTMTFSGDQGFTVANGITTQEGTMHSSVTIDPASTSLSPIAASAFVGALSLPKFELKAGIAPESLLPTNGAFAAQALQLLKLSGYAAVLTNPAPEPPSGSYTQLITSSGSMNFGTMDSFIPCQQTTAEFSLKVGDAASFGVSSKEPSEIYRLNTLHLINPPVQYCARGLASNASPAPSSVATASSCNKSATGSDTDPYGVRGGTVLESFLHEYPNGGFHGGIDIQQLRDAMVFANIRQVVPIDALKHARMLDTQKPTGVGLAGSGDATLQDATVVGQRWYPGCTPVQVKCANPDVDNSWGGMVGLAAHYTYGENKTFTVYLEYEHLIQNPYYPRNDAGVYIDNQGNGVKQGEYESRPLGCVGYGQLMQAGTTLSARQLADHPLIGYLGATQNPHVHIQTAFATGSGGYLKTNFFDPGVVLVH
jgi:hypothetical protein